MIFPIGDDNSDRVGVPVVTYAFIALNVLVFVLFQRLGANEAFTYAWAAVPAELLTGTDIVDEIAIVDPRTQAPVGSIALGPIPLPVHFTLLSAMFMHGSIAHLFGNMLYLWIFGDNLESVLGRVRYIAFYLLTGVLASAAHVAVTVAADQNPYIPSLGASGAISGVLGGYLVLFPRRRVRVIIMRIVTVVPALVAIGLWFVFQLIAGLGMLGGGSDGVAYGAHIGGLVAGVALIRVFAIGKTWRQGGAGYM